LPSRRLGARSHSRADPGLWAGTTAGRCCCCRRCCCCAGRHYRRGPAYSCCRCSATRPGCHRRSTGLATPDPPGGARPRGPRARARGARSSGGTGPRTSSGATAGTTAAAGACSAQPLFVGGGLLAQPPPPPALYYQALMQHHVQLLQPAQAPAAPRASKKSRREPDCTCGALVRTQQQRAAQGKSRPGGFTAQHTAECAWKQHFSGSDGGGEVGAGAGGGRA